MRVRVCRCLLFRSKVYYTSEADVEGDYELKVRIINKVVV